MSVRAAPKAALPVTRAGSPAVQWYGQGVATDYIRPDTGWMAGLPRPGASDAEAPAGARPASDDPVTVLYSSLRARRVEGEAFPRLLGQGACLPERPSTYTRNRQEGIRFEPKAKPEDVRNPDQASRDSLVPCICYVTRH